MLKEILSENKKVIDSNFRDLFSSEFNDLESTGQAMNYMLNLGGGGKRIRSGLLMAVNHIFNGNLKIANELAVAVEMIHTYTLIVDDIQDNSNLRRGKPTCHVMFDVNTAILAALRLFEKGIHIFYKYSPNDVDLPLLFDKLHQGQAADLQVINWKDSLKNVENLKHIHAGKTSSLLQIAILGGCISSNIDLEKVFLLNFGYFLGLAYQAKDDILTISEDSKIVGKPTGAKMDENKLTYYNLTNSLDVSLQFLNSTILEAKKELRNIKSKNVSILFEILEIITNRIS